MATELAEKIAWLAALWPGGLDENEAIIDRVLAGIEEESSEEAGRLHAPVPADEVPV